MLEADLDTGTAGSIDLVGLDRDGALALVAVAADDAGEALARLLDQYVWASSQRALLARLYGAGGLDSDGPLRCLILAPSFSHAFLQRLSLLAIEVTPYLARRVQFRGEVHIWIEPAAAIFGLPGRGGSGNGREDPRRAESGGSAVLVDRFPGAERPAAPGPKEEVAAPEPVPAGPAGDDFQLFDAFPSLLDDPRPAEPLETLTPEELEEFQRFEQTREEDRRKSS
ncbi:MAG: hypothetical protein HY510_02395 [Acidobacteria bacterium]|nr:hypothetical protein [Acidobacteriota bacterium]